MPESCVDKTFEHLFLTLLEDKLIALGIYRLKGATDNEYPYVYTGPSPDTIVTHKDKVFVLGSAVPHYLENDVYHPLDRSKGGNTAQEY